MYSNKQIAAPSTSVVFQGLYGVCFVTVDVQRRRILPPSSQHLLFFRGCVCVLNVVVDQRRRRLPPPRQHLLFFKGLCVL